MINKGSFINYYKQKNDVSNDNLRTPSTERSFLDNYFDSPIFSVKGSSNVFISDFRNIPYKVKLDEEGNEITTTFVNFVAGEYYESEVYTDRIQVDNSTLFSIGDRVRITAYSNVFGETDTFVRVYTIEQIEEDEYIHTITFTEDLHGAFFETDPEGIENGRFFFDTNTTLELVVSYIRYAHIMNSASEKVRFSLNNSAWTELVNDSFGTIDGLVENSMNFIRLNRFDSVLGSYPPYEFEQIIWINHSLHDYHPSVTAYDRLIVDWYNEYIDREFLENVVIAELDPSDVTFELVDDYRIMVLDCNRLDYDFVPTDEVFKIGYTAINDLVSDLVINANKEITY
jgi:hypothetical protein